MARLLVLCGLCAACGASAPGPEDAAGDDEVTNGGETRTVIAPPFHPPDEAAQAQLAPATTEASSADGAADASPDKLSVTAAKHPDLAPEIEGTPIQRKALVGVLGMGIPWFLREVRAEPNLVNGKFTGWRLTRVFDNDPRMKECLIRAGDTVVRVNGASVERPEQFQAVFVALGEASELVLDVVRNGHKSRVHYAIVD